MAWKGPFGIFWLENGILRPAGDIRTCFGFGRFRSPTRPVPAHAAFSARSTKIDPESTKYAVTSSQNQPKSFQKSKSCPTSWPNAPRISKVVSKGTRKPPKAQKLAKSFQKYSLKCLACCVPYVPGVSQNPGSLCTQGSSRTLGKM